MANSPNRERLAKLSYKLDISEPNLRNDKNAKVDILEQQAHYLQEKMSNYLESNNKEIKSIKEQIMGIRNLMNEEKVNREKMLEARYRDIASIESHITHLIENEMKTKKESDYRLTNLINQRHNELKDYLKRETALREENINLLNATLESDLPKLSEGIKKEREEQTEADNTIMKKCQEEVNSLREFVNKERYDREESERTINEMLKSVFSKVKDDIELEKANREATEETLMGLLDETCKKINDAAHI